MRIGFVPAIVSTFLLRQVGEKVARDLLLTGRLFDAEEAHRIGLVSEIVPADDLMKRARELAAQLMENSPASLLYTKRLLSSAARAEMDTQIDAAVQRMPRFARLPISAKAFHRFWKRESPSGVRRDERQHARNCQCSREPPGGGE